MKKIYATPELETYAFDSDIKTDVIRVSGWTSTATDGKVDTGTDFENGNWGN